MTRIALLQMTTGIDPAANAERCRRAVREAARGRGGRCCSRPKCAACSTATAARAAASIVSEDENPSLAAVREAAAKAGMWVALGSLAIAREDGRWANRSFVIDPAGEIAARYDKIHMFDVELWRAARAGANPPPMCRASRW